MNRSLSTRDVSSEAIAEASGVMRSYHHGESRRGLTITSDRREGEEARCARATRRSRARLGHDASSSIPQCWSVSKVVTTPHLDVEQGLFVEGYELVGSLDEVGRGSAFGPCCVGLCVVDATVGTVPTGLRDSKLLSSRTRDGLVAPIDSWALDHAVGEASAGEIDEFGLTAALRLAGYRALSQLRVAPDILILDGSYDWMSMPAQEPLTPVPYPDVRVAPVRTRVKADLTCVHQWPRPASSPRCTATAWSWSWPSTYRGTTWRTTRATSPRHTSRRCANWDRVGCTASRGTCPRAPSPDPR